MEGRASDRVGLPLVVELEENDEGRRGIFWNANRVERLWMTHLSLYRSESQYSCVDVMYIDIGRR